MTLIIFEAIVHVSFLLSCAVLVLLLHFRLHFLCFRHELVCPQYFDDFFSYPAGVHASYFAVVRSTFVASALSFAFFVLS